MSNSSKQNIEQVTILDKQDTLAESVKILSDITRRDIEKSYNIDTTVGTEAYYSNRYGWTLRRSID